ncbi:MAG: methyltransferase domain-containing protein [Micromonosporaceae bacterium]|nr:methyltransferase domain-containing protein [Micromonosporaceae bacterium]
MSTADRREVPVSTYVFDQAWQKELDRLGALESLYDRASRQHLASLGVGDGWRCLEVGAGAGGIARWLADRVGETGQVLATDLDTRFLDAHGRTNLDVLTHNIVADPLEEASFDLVHARAVLVHLPERDKVLPKLVTVLRPGGWLLVEDIDFGGATGPMMTKYLDGPPAAAQAFARVGRAIEAVHRAAGADPSLGSHLAADLRTAGLSNVDAEVHAPLARGGPQTFLRGTVEALAQRLVATGPATTEDIEYILRFCDAPESAYLPPLMVSAWGQRPGA